MQMRAWMFTDEVEGAEGQKVLSSASCRSLSVRMNCLFGNLLVSEDEVEEVEWKKFLSDNRRSLSARLNCLFGR